MNVGDVNASEIGLSLSAETGDTEKGGDVSATAGEISGGQGGLYAKANMGNVAVNTKGIESGDYGVSLSLDGTDSQKGIQANVDGDVHAQSTGISVSSSSHTTYEYDDDYNEIGQNTIYSNHYAKVNTGAVEAGTDGVHALNNGGEFDIKVNGGVTVSCEQTYVDDYSGYTRYNHADGVVAQNASGRTSILIDGDLSIFSVEKEVGEYDYQDENASEETGEEETYDSEDRYTGNGVTIGNYGGEIDITINGDVDAAEGTAVTINKERSWEKDANNGEAVLNIAGNVYAENGIDVGIEGNGSGHVSINIEGELYTSGTGLKLGEKEWQYETNWDDEETDENPEPGEDTESVEEPGQTGLSGAHYDETEGNGNGAEETTSPDVDIIVQETISGTTPIFVENIVAAMNTLITTWAVKPNENNQITTDQNGNSVEEVEKNINYIIKKEDNEQYGTLNVVGTTDKIIGKAGDEANRRGTGEENPDKKTLKVAKQDNALTLSVDLKEQYRKGYDVVIYNGKGDNKLKAEVTKKENGEFTFIVPWAGGVYLSFDLEKDPNYVPDPEP